MTFATDERWLNTPEFQDKKGLYFKSNSLEREIALPDVLSMHIDDLRSLMLEIEAENAIQRFHSDFNSEIEKIDPSHEWKESHKRFAFKRFVLVFFGKAISREIKYRTQVERSKSFSAMDKEIIVLARKALGPEKFSQIISQAKTSLSDK